MDADPAVTPPRILVVEDEPSLRNTMAMALRSCGHQTTTAESGFEALNLLHDVQPALVLLDLQLPEMDGWEFLRQFRARPGCSAVPVVVTSAAHRVVTRELAAQAFLPKPFDLDELLDLVDALLQRPSTTTESPATLAAATTIESPATLAAAMSIESPATLAAAT